MDNKKNKNSCWKNRTKIEKLLLLVIVLAVVLAVFLASHLFIKLPTAERSSADMCMTPKCIRSAARILDKMDQTVDPCDDFYKFTCGNFIQKTIIPDEKVAISSFSDVGDKTELQMKEIFEEGIEEHDPHSLRLLKTIYKACMNVSRIESEGMNYFKRLFKESGGWPVLESNYWNEKNFDWKKLLYRFRRLGLRQNVFFSLYIGIDQKNSTLRMLKLGQPCFNYERLKKGLNDTKVQAYLEYMIDVTSFFGVDKSQASQDMIDVIEFEITIAKMMVPWEQRKNSTLEYNPITIRELQRELPSIPWLQFINNFLSVEKVSNEDYINVGLPKFMGELEDLLLKTPKRTLANYMYWAVVKGSMLYLPEAIRKKNDHFISVLYGQQEASPRWKDCMWEAESLHVATSSVYVKRLFDKRSKNKVSELVQDIRSAFFETLNDIGWMDRKTKKHAIEKAEKMRSLIGYPEELLNSANVENYYEGLNLSLDPYPLEIDLNVSLFHHYKNVRKLRDPVIKHDWMSQSYIFYVNAYYDGSDNSIELPAAVLQDGFYDPERPMYLNYGSIGYIIGHEITHGFDDHGRQYDKDGNLMDWWAPETNKTFTIKAKCLIDQYSNYSVPEIDMNLNGEKNQGENIADNGGIKIAYRGYRKWMERNDDEKSLPGLPYNPKQMFWIAAASSWCTKYRKELLKEHVLSGFHSPSYFRVVVPFMNSGHFAKDFSCPLGSPMNPKNKCRVW